MSMEDARDRIEEARVQLDELDDEIGAWLQRYLGRIFEKRNPQDPKTRRIDLPMPEESVITGRPKVLVSQIIENMRVALDYAVFALSKKNCPGMNERHPKFVIVDNKADFGRAAKNSLRYLTDDERDFIELLQPYRVKSGTTSVMELIRDAANVSKHRNLLSIRQQANSVLIVVADQKDDRFGEEWWQFPAQDGSGFFFVKVSDLKVLLIGRYNLLEVLPRAHIFTSALIDLFDAHLDGKPLPDSLEKVHIKVIRPS